MCTCLGVSASVCLQATDSPWVLDETNNRSKHCSMHRSTAPRHASALKCFRHKVSRVIHVAKDCAPPDEGEMTVFRCGRFANRNYEELTETPTVLIQKCSSCWGASDLGH